MSLDPKTAPLPSKHVCFYKAVNDVMSYIGFRFKRVDFTSFSKNEVFLRHSLEDFLGLVSQKKVINGVMYSEVFTRSDLSEVKALTSYPNLNSFYSGNFAYYVIGSNSPLGLLLDIKQYPKIPDSMKTELAIKDFVHGKLAKVNDFYIFSLASLYSLVDSPKFVIPGNDLKC